jgi:hypothetical protein
MMPSPKMAGQTASLKALLMRVVVGGLLVLSLLFAALYWFMLVYTIKVANQSGQTLTDVQLLVPGVPRLIGTMPPGATRWVFAQPERDGELALSFDAAGKRKLEEDKAYMGAAGGGRIAVIVQPSLRVTFEHKILLP